MSDESSIARVSGRRGTTTSNFGVSRRESHDASGFYDRFEPPVVDDDDTVLTPGGLRHADEAVRHKMLDALGDLALAGAPILGRYTGVRAGHMLTNQLLRALFVSHGAWRVVECTPQQAASLPGIGVTGADLAHVA